MRLVTDLVRFEDQEGEDAPRVNINAGYDIARFFRDRHSHIPILVRTHAYNIAHTKFVRTMPPAGSTVDYEVIQKFIDEMVAKEPGDMSWAKYDAPSGGSAEDPEEGDI